MEEEIEKRFREIEKRLDLLEGAPKEKLKVKTSENLEAKIKRLCEEAEITIENFYHIFFIEDNSDILLLKVPNGKNEAEKQHKISLLLLTASEYLFNQDFMKSSELIKKLEKLGVKSLVNLSTNLSKHRQFFIPRGKPKSKNFGFQITIPGKKEGLNIIKELLENE